MEEFSFSHGAHELWHDIKPFLAGGIAAIVGAVVLVCRKRIRGWFNREDAMTAGDRWRGHPISLLEGCWFYSDGVAVKDDKDRRCGECGLPNRPDGHDPCLGELPGVRNACCGHGDENQAYIQFARDVLGRKQSPQ